MTRGFGQINRRITDSRSQKEKMAKILDSKEQTEAMGNLYESLYCLTDDFSRDFKLYGGFETGLNK